MALNQDNLIWDEKPMPEGLDLPRIKYASCPRDKRHTKTILDVGGKLRCAHIEKATVREGFSYDYHSFDEHSNLDETISSKFGPIYRFFIFWRGHSTVWM